MRVTRKILLIAVVTSVALFVIAAPFGQEKNHHSFSYEFGNVIFVLFLISVPVLLILVITALVQAVLARRATSH